MAITQDNRPIRITIGSLDPTGYLLTGFKGREAMSELFEFKIDLVAPVEAPLDFSKVIGQNAVISFEIDGGKTRKIIGIISRLSQGRKVARFIHYKADFVPPLWLLTNRQNFSVFQQQTSSEIFSSRLTTVSKLQKNTVTLTKTYFPRNFCCQYRETDFDFASRMMEDEGIFYYFDHTGNQLEMVVSDSNSKCRDLPTGKKVHFQDDLGNATGELISEWTTSQGLYTGLVKLTDHHFQKPSERFDIMGLPVDSVKAGTVSHDLTIGERGSHSVEDAPGGYAHWRDDIDQSGSPRSDMAHAFDDAKRIADVRMKQIEVNSLTIEGAGTVTGLTPGFLITLENHFEADGDYLITSVEHSATCGAAQSGEKFDSKYANTFTCLPVTVEFKPQVKTEKPFIRGTQTGTVIGTDGEDMEPDKFGRVKVLFRWDPLGPRQLESSCWVRVAQQWAGRQWGFQFIPRISDEVIVAFEEGDPDKPIIIGSVWNADNMPLYELPKNKTQSGIKTTSSPKGSTTNFNEIKFEDKKGAEFISIHAEHNMMTTVENSHTISVGSTSESSGSDTKKTGLLSTTVYGDMSTTVTKGDMHETIKAGNFTREVTAGTSTTHVCSTVTENYDAQQFTTVKSDQLTHITGGGHFCTVDSGVASLKVKGGNRIVDVTGVYQVTASDHILLKCGGSTITIKPDTIIIDSPNIKIQGGTLVDVIGGGAVSEWKGNKATLVGSAGVDIGSGPVKITSSAKVTITGSPVEVNS